MINEEELEYLVSSANMFIVSPTTKHDAWATNNELVRVRMAKRDKAKRAIVEGLREIAQGLENGLIGQITTNRRK